MGIEKAVQMMKGIFLTGTKELGYPWEIWQKAFLKCR
jgi:hypothetical protein